jgi:hypothetical protein
VGEQVRVAPDPDEEEQADALKEQQLLPQEDHAGGSEHLDHSDDRGVLVPHLLRGRG